MSEVIEEVQTHLYDRLVIHALPGEPCEFLLVPDWRDVNQSGIATLSKRQTHNTTHYILLQRWWDSIRLDCLRVLTVKKAQFESGLPETDEIYQEVFDKTMHRLIMGISNQSLFGYKSVGTEGASGRGHLFFLPLDEADRTPYAYALYFQELSDRHILWVQTPGGMFRIGTYEGLSLNCIPRRASRR